MVPDGYRDRALTCMAVAEGMRHSPDRRAMLEIAQLYLKLADQIDAANTYTFSSAHSGTTNTVKSCPSL